MNHVSTDRSVATSVSAAIIATVNLASRAPTVSTRSSTAPHSRVSTAELVSTTPRYATPLLLHAGGIGIVFVGVCPFVSVLVCLSAQKLKKNLIDLRVLCYGDLGNSTRDYILVTFELDL